MRLLMEEINEVSQADEARRDPIMRLDTTASANHIELLIKEIENIDVEKLVDGIIERFKKSNGITEGYREEALLDDHGAETLEKIIKDNMEILPPTAREINRSWLSNVAWTAIAGATCVGAAASGGTVGIVAGVIWGTITLLRLLGFKKQTRQGAKRRARSRAFDKSTDEIALNIEKYRSELISEVRKVQTEWIEHLQKIQTQQVENRAELDRQAGNFVAAIGTYFKKARHTGV